MPISRFIALFVVVLVTGCAFNDSVESDSSLSYSRKAYRAGSAAAQHDVQAGILATESAGLPAEWRGEYVQLLKQRYGIETRSVAGCVVDEKIVGHMVGYNEVSNAEIKRRFGTDVFERTAKDAQTLYKKKHPKGSD